MKKTPLPNTFIDGKQIFTKNLQPGKKFFEQEWTKNIKGIEYRELSPKSSKLAAALAKGCQQFGITEGGVVLYLGASHGYTPSFVSDMIGKDGLMYCVEFAPVVARDLVFICEERKNMIPILADANLPDDYATRITGVDVVFQDIAQKEQVEIFMKNVNMFLKSGGFGMLALKAKSIDVTRKSVDIFKDVRKSLEERQDVVIVDYRELYPFEKDHAFFVVKKR